MHKFNPFYYLVAHFPSKQFTLNKTEKIVVTGGTGMVGAHLLKYLLHSGYSNITAIHRPTSQFKLVDSISASITWVECDILDIVTLEEIMEGAKWVFHTAAIVSFEKKDKKLMDAINIEGTANIVNLCLHFNVEKLLHVSSIAAIGRKKNQNTITEKTEWENSEENTPYAQTKYFSEMEVWRGVAEGLDTVIVNPSIILGTSYWEQSSAKLFSLVDGGLKFYPTGTTGFVDVRDVAKFSVLAMESIIVNQRFILNGDNVSHQFIFNEIADSIHKTKPSIKVTPLISGIYWRLALLASFFTRKSPKITKSTSKYLMKDYFYDNYKSKKALDYEYYPIKKTIQDIGVIYLKGKDPSLLAY